MAADTRVSAEGAPHWHATKIFRIGESLFGTAGDGFMSLTMIEWLKTNRSRPALYKIWADYERDGFWLLELNPSGLYIWDGWGVPEKLIDKRYAIGSGAQAALAALDAGMSPEDAVKGATKYDQYSGPPIQVEYVLPPELTAKVKRKR
jgi:20S proteasome alpha/beta subunit